MPMSWALITARSASNSPEDLLQRRGKGKKNQTHHQDTKAPRTAALGALVSWWWSVLLVTIFEPGSYLIFFNEGSFSISLAVAAFLPVGETSMYFWRCILVPFRLLSPNSTMASMKWASP